MEPEPQEGDVSEPDDDEEVAQGANETYDDEDDKKIENSETVRVYHGFGDDTIAIKNNHLHAKINENIIEKTGDHFIFNIETEAVISFYDS